jgi:hypothetical protein
MNLINIVLLSVITYFLTKIKGQIATHKITDIQRVCQQHPNLPYVRAEPTPLVLSKVKARGHNVILRHEGSAFLPKNISDKTSRSFSSWDDTL